MNFKIFGQLLIITVIVLGGCDQSNLCISGQSSIQAGLYSPSEPEGRDTTLTGITLWGLNNDSILADSTRVNKLFLPADLNSDSCTFVMREDKLVGETVISYSDTLLFVYSRDLNYISGDCGFSYDIELDTVIHTNNIIDSVIIDNASVLYNENFENVKIFIEP